MILVTMLVVILGTKLKFLRYSEEGAMLRSGALLVAPLTIVLADYVPNAPFMAMVFVLIVLGRGFIGRSEPAPSNL